MILVVLEVILCITRNGTTRRCTEAVGATMLALNVLVKITVVV